MEKIRITVFADPACTWCWGSVPVLRALAYRYGEHIEISYVMGGMIEDILSYNNRRLSIGGDIALSNRNIHNHWIEASAVHGMPVKESVVQLFSENRRSTLPLNMAYIAACEYEKKHPDVMENASLRYLRALQEVTAVEGVHTNDDEGVVAVSSLVGFERREFSRIYKSDDVRRLYDNGKKLCRAYEVHSFPTFKICYRNEEMVVRGFTTYETLCRCISQLSYDSVHPICDGREHPTVYNVRNFIAEHGTAYPVEVATAFAMPRENGHTALNIESYMGLPDIIEELIKSNELAMAPKGNGFIFYTLRADDGYLRRRRREMAGIS